MKQEKLSFADPRKQKPEKGQYTQLELLCHSAYVCDESGRLLYRNRFAASAFPEIRTGMLFTRFCDIPLSDGSLFIRPVMGFLRYVLCRYLSAGRFELQIPGGMVMEQDRLPRYAETVKQLLSCARYAAEQLSRIPPALRRSKPHDPAFGDLGELLSKTLSDLSAGPPVNPRMTVSVSNLLEAVRRRSAKALSETGADFDFDCPPRLLCSARFAPTVFILLNLLCFFRICLGQRRLFLQVSETPEHIRLQLHAPTLLSPAPFYATLFPKNNQTALNDALLATPFSLAAAAAAREGFPLDCVFQKDGMKVNLCLPLLKGNADLWVTDFEQLDLQLGKTGIAALMEAIFRWFQP